MATPSPQPATDLAQAPKTITTRSLPPALLPAARLVSQTPYLLSRSDPRLTYALYVPAQHYNASPPSTGPPSALLPVVVLVHGTTRRASELLDAFRGLADAARCALVAPVFPAGAEGPNDWGGYRELRKGRRTTGTTTGARTEGGEGSGDGERRGESGGSGASQLPPFDADVALWRLLTEDIPERWPGLRLPYLPARSSHSSSPSFSSFSSFSSPPPTAHARTDLQIALAGFSAGASFAQRLALLYPERMAGVCLAAPGSLTSLDDGGGSSWPAGVRGVEEIFGGRGIGDVKAVGGGGWGLVVGDADDAIEGDLEAIEERVRGWEADPERDWEAVVRAAMRARREVMEEFARELGARGADVGGGGVEVVPGGRHNLGDLRPAMERFLEGVVRGMWAGSGK